MTREVKVVARVYQRASAIVKLVGEFTVGINEAPNVGVMGRMMTIVFYSPCNEHEALDIDGLY